MIVMSGDPQDSGHYHIQAYTPHHGQPGVVPGCQQGYDQDKTKDQERIPDFVPAKAETLELEGEHWQLADEKI